MPSCKQDLGNTRDSKTWDPELKELGYSFECEHNGHRFERPIVLHFCPKCGSVFDYKTAIYVSLNAYILTQSAYDLVKHSSEIETLVKPLIDFLKVNGLDIVYGFEVKGLSGSTHKFDLAATFGTSLLVVDYSFGESQKLVSLLGKKLDVPGVEAVLVDFSNNEELFNLGKVYNIPIIDPGNKDWTKPLHPVLERLRSKPVEKKDAQKRNLWGQ